MRLFKRKKEESKPQGNELYDIPVGSMIEHGEPIPEETGEHNPSGQHVSVTI